MRANFIYQLKDFSAELFRIGAVTAILCTPVLGLAYTFQSPERERAYIENQKSSAQRADVNKSRTVDYKELPEFLRTGGRLFIR